MSKVHWSPNRHFLCTGAFSKTRERSLSRWYENRDCGSFDVEEYYHCREAQRLDDLDEPREFGFAEEHSSTRISEDNSRAEGTAHL